MTLLPDVGKLSYSVQAGQATFNVLYTSTVSGSPVLDKAKRTVKYVKYTFEVKAWVTLGDKDDATTQTIDGQMQTLRYILQAQGGKLIYTGKGFGSPFIINGGGNGPNDVCWGPIPELLDFQPLGASCSALIHWRISTCIPECPDAAFNNALLEFTYSSSLSYDERGFGAFSFRVVIEIPMTRLSQSNRNIPDSIDRYRPLTEPNIPLGFRPVNRSFEVSEDGRVCVWEYSYEEIPAGGVPADCLMARGNYTVSNNRPPGFSNWTCTLRATYVVVRDQPRRMAWVRFLGLLQTRLNIGAANAVVPQLPNVAQGGGGAGAVGGAVGGSWIGALLLGPVGISIGGLIGGIRGAQNAGQPPQPAQQNTAILMQTFSFDEGLYLDSDKTSFQCSWKLITTFASIMRASGVWQADLSTDYRVWYASIKDLIGSSSWTRLTIPRADVIIDACKQVSSSQTGVNKPRAYGSSAFQDSGPTGPSDRVSYAGLPQSVRSILGIGGVSDSYNDDRGNPELRAPVPGVMDPRVSWLNYRCSVKVELDPGNVLHKPLPQYADESDTMASYDAYDLQGADNVNNVNGPSLASVSTGVDVVQKAATSTYRVCLKGWGLRAGYPVPIPGIVSFGGVSPVEDTQESESEVVANMNGIPIFLSTWELWYHVPQVMTEDQEPPPNLAQHIAGSAVPPTLIQPPISVPEPGPITLPIGITQ